VTEISVSYLLCATPRTGSNFFCEVLSSTGVAGRPEEYFWQRSFWYECWGVSDFPSFLDQVREHGTSRNGVFGSKLMWDQVNDLLRELVTLLGVTEESPARVLEAAFPNLHYVWLRRTDRARQGISHYRALETRRWRSTDTSSSPPEPAFNFESIRSLMRLCEWEDASWREFFQQNTITPLVVSYEELAAAPVVTACRVIDHLGLEVPERLPTDTWRHQRQADTLTDEWVARYGAELANSRDLSDEEVLRILGTWTA
jgi:trehalose 2-sulfotransferase